MVAGRCGQAQRQNGFAQGAKGRARPPRPVVSPTRYTFNIPATGRETRPLQIYFNFMVAGRRGRRPLRDIHLTFLQRDEKPVFTVIFTTIFHISSVAAGGGYMLK